MHSPTTRKSSQLSNTNGTTSTAMVSNRPAGNRYTLNSKYFPELSPQTSPSSSHENSPTKYTDFSSTLLQRNNSSPNKKKILQAMREPQIEYHEIRQQLDLFDPSKESSKESTELLDEDEILHQYNPLDNITHVHVTLPPPKISVVPFFKTVSKPKSLTELPQLEEHQMQTRQDVQQLQDKVQEHITNLETLLKNSMETIYQKNNITYHQIQKNMIDLKKTTDVPSIVLLNRAQSKAKDVLLEVERSRVATQNKTKNINYNHPSSYM